MMLSFSQKKSKILMNKYSQCPIQIMILILMINSPKFYLDICVTLILVIVFYRKYRKIVSCIASYAIKCNVYKS